MYPSVTPIRFSTKNGIIGDYTSTTLTQFSLKFKLWLFVQEYVDVVYKIGEVLPVSLRVVTTTVTVYIH